MSKRVPKKSKSSKKFPVNFDCIWTVFHLFLFYFWSTLGLLLVLTIPDGNWWKFKSSLERNEKSWWKSGFLEFSEWSCALDLTNISPFFRPIRIGFEVAQSGQNCQIGFFRNVDGEDDWGLFDRIWCLPQKCTSSFLRVSNGLRLGFCAFLCIFQVNVGNNDTLKKKKKKKKNIREYKRCLNVDCFICWFRGGRFVSLVLYFLFNLWYLKLKMPEKWFAGDVDVGLRGPRGRVWIELNC